MHSKVIDGLRDFHHSDLVQASRFQFWGGQFTCSVKKGSVSITVSPARSGEGLGGDREHWTPPIIAFSALTTKSQTKVMEDLIIQSKRLRFQFGGGRGDIVGNPAVMNSFGILSWD